MCAAYSGLESNTYETVRDLLWPPSGDANSACRLNVALLGPPLRTGTMYQIHSRMILSGRRVSPSGVRKRPMPRDNVSLVIQLSRKPTYLKSISMNELV